MASGNNLIAAVANTIIADNGPSGLFTLLGQPWLNEVPNKYSQPYPQIKAYKETLQYSLEYPVWNIYPITINVIGRPAQDMIDLAKRVLQVFKFNAIGEPPLSVAGAYIAYFTRTGYEVQDTRDRDQSNRVVTRVSIGYACGIADQFNG